jgi:L-fucose isomerase-like protein
MTSAELQKRALPQPNPAITASGFPKHHAARLGVLFIGRQRPGFDMEWGRHVEMRVRDALKQTDFEIFEPVAKATDDTSLRAALNGCREAGVEALVLLQTTMGDGRLAPTLAQLWPDPVILWATPEKQEGDMVSSCSLVGAHVWASTFRHMGHAFDLVYGDSGSSETLHQLKESVRIAVTLKRLRTARLGMIGSQAPGFLAMNIDPFSAHRVLGVQVQNFSLLEFANAVNAVTEEDVAIDLAHVKAPGLPHKDTSDGDLPMASRMYLAMRGFIEHENLQAMTIRCWPEIPNTFGQWPYLGIARLVDEGYPIACEGDADGALSAWIGETLGMGRCYLTDWLEHDANTITLWHGGAAPMSLCETQGNPGSPQFARHFNNKKPGVVEATIRENMPVTIMRLWACDGQYHLTAREGRTLKPKRHLLGTNCLAQLSNEQPGRWLGQICHAGMPHHVALFEGHHEQLLRRLALIMNVKFL